jgi:hypothetical protein
MAQQRHGLQLETDLDQRSAGLRGKLKVNREFRASEKLYEKSLQGRLLIARHFSAGEQLKDNVGVPAGTIEWR